MNNYKKKYSNDFIKIISDKKKARKFFEDSYLFVNTFEQYKERRISVIKAIYRQGSILDIGCANGFFLKFLQEHSRYRINPYGIDVDPAQIKKTRKMFPKKIENFVNISVQDFIYSYDRTKFPVNFDFIYWHVWNNCNFEINENFKIFKNLFKKIKKEGRLILKFTFLKKEEENYNCITQLEKKGVNFDVKIKELVEPGILAWIEKKEN